MSKKQNQEQKTEDNLKNKEKETQEEESKKQRKLEIKEIESSQDITKVTFGPCKRLTWPKCDTHKDKGSSTRLPSSKEGNIWTMSSMDQTWPIQGQGKLGHLHHQPRLAQILAWQNVIQT
ncbi:hypothetical protein PIB30_063004 [Stylosanthes scabra]|uniref:Uncharacterized protein n=1 Tax=Stylosanthes scabra TaxID=79078 RepID=A0ABU6UNH9_9FABA|nr:hypothetical protein [Stylosanthes scabra]